MQKQTINIEAFRKAMGNYPTGVTVVTTFDQENQPVGLTVNSFASLSLEPLMVLWSIDHGSNSLDAFNFTDKFAVHILAENQSTLAREFAVSKEDKFENVEWEASANSLPVLKDVLSVLECKVHDKIVAGDHTIMIGEVIDIQNTEKNPLLYHRRVLGPIPEEFYE